MSIWTERLPPAFGEPAPRGYILCATPRSGSTMLCGMLAECGAGWPASYYRPQQMPERCEALGIAFDDSSAEFHRAYLRTVRSLGAAGTGLFGMRLMWENAENLFSELAALFPGVAGQHARLEAAFGPLTYVHLSRRDKAAQAASLLRARTGGLWHLAADGSEIERDPPLWGAGEQPDNLEDYVAELTANDAAWTRWFAGQRIQPVTLSYEALAADPTGQLRRVLGALGVDPARADTVRPPTAKLPGQRGEASN